LYAQQDQFVEAAMLEEEDEFNSPIGNAGADAGDDLSF
jgi:hypothetical protein